MEETPLVPSLLAYAAPLALFVPILGQGLDAPLALPGEADGQGPVFAAGQGPDREEPEHASPRAIPPEPLPDAAPLSAFRERQVARQVRIEQRVVIRISPQRGAARQQLLATLPRKELETRYEERKMGECLPIERIAGVQTGSGNRLLLFLKDKRIVTVNLEKTCHARDFYSGFYVEKNEDGKLCVDRDRIKSRTGVKCEVERMRRLVAVKEE
ncbi:MAG: hypothetical protein RIB52_07775 [Erythrobacter sp.]|uniref:hypothetical protein n=1 Tax=Erythrobacter sp. TaxID=1042 RepID=UPI0032EB8A37